MKIRSALIGAIITLSSTAMASNGDSYYDQFLYKVLGSCSNPSSVEFHDAYSWEPALLGPDSQGRPVTASLSVELMTDGTYSAEYSEDALIKLVEPGVAETESVFKNIFKGNWSVTGTQITLQGLGTGTPIQRTDSSGQMKASFQFKFSVAVHDSRTLNTSVTMGSSISNLGANGISIDQYCGIQPLN